MYATCSGTSFRWFEPFFAEISTFENTFSLISGIYVRIVFFFFEVKKLKNWILGLFEVKKFFVLFSS